MSLNNFTVVSMYIKQFLLHYYSQHFLNNFNCILLVNKFSMMTDTGTNFLMLSTLDFCTNFLLLFLTINEIKLILEFSRSEINYYEVQIKYKICFSIKNIISVIKKVKTKYTLKKKTNMY